MSQAHHMRNGARKEAPVLAIAEAARDTADLVTKDSQ